jgi:ubiquinone/menaquinone biosynthesis C-methylase UbiE
VSFYGSHILPRLVDRTCGMRLIDPLRRRVCAGLHGEVVEVGFGTGLNVPHYPAAVTRVSGIEPEPIGWQLARKRLDASMIQMAPAGLDGQRLDLPDDAFDCALSTFTMCTIPDAGAALHEIRRVLKPGGTYAFLEHGLAPENEVRVWQRRLEPIQKRLVGGCHLTRDIRALVEDAGFTVTEAEVFYQDGAARPYGALTLATATL